MSHRCLDPDSMEEVFFMVVAFVLQISLAKFRLSSGLIVSEKISLLSGFDFPQT